MASTGSMVRRLRASVDPIGIDRGKPEYEKHRQSTCSAILAVEIAAPRPELVTPSRPVPSEGGPGRGPASFRNG